MTRTVTLRFNSRITFGFNVRVTPRVTLIPYPQVSQ